MRIAWQEDLNRFLKGRPLYLIRFEADRWQRLLNSHRGVGEFSLAVDREVVKDLRVPSACLIHGAAFYGDEEQQLRFGLIVSKRHIATLQSLLKIRWSVRVRPDRLDDLVRLLPEARLSGRITRSLERRSFATKLTPSVALPLITRLAARSENHDAMRWVVEAALSIPKSFGGNRDLQHDAIRVAMAAFGLQPEDRASYRELPKSNESGLSRIHLLEDAVIEHSGRVVPGFVLREASMTGRAVFVRGSEQLEIITANKRPLEEAFGVDLIYFNVVQKSIVMMQYKMLEAHRVGGLVEDWIYRPDAQLDKEVRSMRRFSGKSADRSEEYRLNSDVFYLKFVKRDASVKRGSMVVPLQHFERISAGPGGKGPKGGRRISYNAMAGRYLREGDFLGLLRSGYIGSHSDTTEKLMTLVEHVLREGHAAVVAMQSLISTHSDD